MISATVVTATTISPSEIATGFFSEEVSVGEGVNVGVGVAVGIGVGVGVGGGVVTDEGDGVGVGVVVGVVGVGVGVAVSAAVRLNKLLVPVSVPSVAVIVTFEPAVDTVTEVEPTPLTKSFIVPGLIDPTE